MRSASSYCLPAEDTSDRLAYLSRRVNTAQIPTCADALLSTIPTIPALWRKPAVAVVHDLRHEDRPADFTVPVRLVRRFLFGAAYRRVDHLVADSNRTAEGLRARHPRTGSRISVVHLGADHIKGPSSTRRGAALAFAAKEPALLLQAWAILLRNARYGGMQLHIVALGEPQRANLAREALNLGVANHVILDPYLGGNRFGELMAEASAVLLPSRHEGFGLPVLEAMRRNIPVMISPDPALREIAAGHAACAASWAPADLAVAIERALCMTNQELVAARAHPDHFTWRRTAELTRAAVEIAARHHSLGS